MTEVFLFMAVIVVCFTVLVWKALDLLDNGVNIFSFFKKKKEKNCLKK